MRLFETPLRAFVDAETWAVVLFCAATLVGLAVSPMALDVIGIDYGASGGPMWQKLHPATYLALLALLLDVFGGGRPLRRVAAIFAAAPGLAYFLAMLLLTLGYGVLVQKLPATALVDIYFLAIVILAMDDRIPPPHRDFLRRAIHALLFLNALIGVAEYFTHERLFPYVIMGVPVEGDYRSTALLGHPLLNASTTGAYVICLSLGGDPRLPFAYRAVLLATSLLGMVAFGGRTAIVVAGAILGLLLSRKMLAILAGARFDGRRLLALLLATPMVAGALVFAFANGAFDALIGRFLDDNGSAKARVIMFELFRLFDVDDLLLGPRQDLVDSALSSLGIQIGIENTWVSLVFQYGLWMTGFFVIGLAALFFEFWRRTRAGGAFLFIYFLVIISSATGLATKSQMFTQFVVVSMFIFHAETPALAAAPRRRTAADAAEPRAASLGAAARLSI